MRGPAPAAILVLGAFLLAYLPDVGHGFVKDDFGWIVDGDRFLHAPSVALFTDTTGFFRPLVTLSFALNAVLFGHGAFGYGVTNLLLALACAALVYRLCRDEELSPAAASVAAGAWLFNFHGINMAVLWISGRTSLLLTLCALLAAHAVLRERRWHAALWCLAALFCKEEAVALPFMLAAWSSVTRSARASWPLLLPLIVYLAVRVASDAFWPGTAPVYYRFTFDPGAVLINLAHYFDRACTTSIVVALLVMLAAGRPFTWSPRDRSRVLHGAAWLIGGFAITAWLPVRSSLYAVFPSVGAVLILATFVDSLWRTLEAPARTRVAAVLVVMTFLLNPVYRARNERWVELADLSRNALTDLTPAVPSLRAGTRLLLLDDTVPRANLESAIGRGLIPDAIAIHHGLRVDVQILDDARELAGLAAQGPTVALQLEAGRLVPFRAP